MRHLTGQQMPYLTVGGNLLKQAVISNQSVKCTSNEAPTQNISDIWIQNQSVQPATVSQIGEICPGR